MVGWGGLIVSAEDGMRGDVRSGAIRVLMLSDFLWRWAGVIRERGSRLDRGRS